MWMTSVPAPSTEAPILLSTRPSSSTSGSRAAFTRVVRPFASAAALIRFYVPVTVGRSKQALTVGEQRRAEDRQRGVLRSAHLHHAGEPPSAANSNGVHGSSNVSTPSAPQVKDCRASDCVTKSNAVTFELDANRPHP